ncbi:MAG: FGGY-family carbohydrate kinase, partial [candidate division NC10 bacterium]|nr:FGGY-family carbohydrate kinase [candidate division NC10 bacterium]
LIRGRREKERFLLLDDWSSSVPLGCDGLLFLPYLTGERSPHWRREAKASFFGIDSHHHRGHFARAVMEGLGFQMKRVFEVMEEVGGAVNEVRFTGGFTRSPLWSQMMCDILGREAQIPYVKDSSALGAAAMAALGLGLIPSLAAVKEKVKVEKSLRPDLESHQRYQRLYGLFGNLYQDSVRGWEELEQMRASEALDTREGGGK